MVKLEDPQFWITLAALRRTPQQWHAYKWRTSLFYKHLVKEMSFHIWPKGDVPFLFQIEPNLRVHPVGNRGIAAHTDAEFGHQEEEWNVWVPLMEITDPTQTLWLDGEAQMVPLGHAVIFPGAVVTHGSICNLSGTERRSFDFRLIRQEDYIERPERKSVLYGVPLTLGEYWRE